MFWYLFFALVAIFLFLPFNTRVSLKLNVLNLSGELCVQIFAIKMIKLKIKIKGNFIYITKKGITYKEKLTANNVDVIFVIKFVANLYFRMKINEIFEAGQYGIKDDALSTSILCSGFDLLIKSALAKIKNNKKLSHIFIINCAKYNEDCLNFKLECDFNINIADILYSFVLSKLSSKGVKYERTRQREQGEEHN